MAKLSIQGGATDITLTVFICDSTAAYPLGLTGLVWNTLGLSCYYVRERTAAAAQALAAVAVAGAHLDGGFVEIDAANMPGMYRLDLKDAVIAAGARHVNVMLQGAANMVPTVVEIDLDAELGNTQGQVKFLCNVAGEGALHIYNSNATGHGTYTRGGTGGHGLYTWGGECGQYNRGSNTDGVHNIGSGTGLYNESIGAGGSGQYNHGDEYGLLCTADSTGLACLGRDDYGIQATGGINGAALTGTAGYGIKTVGGTLGTDGFEEEILDAPVDGAHTLRQLTRVESAALCGMSTGGATPTIRFRNVDDTKTRIIATVDHLGNRLAVTLDETP